MAKCLTKLKPFNFNYLDNSYLWEYKLRGVIYEKVFDFHFCDSVYNASK